MGIQLDTSLGLNLEALKLRQHRLELIASNIANADTPGYKAQDLDFGTALKAAVSKRQDQSMFTTNASHVQASGGGSSYNPAEAHVFRTNLQASLDGNTVSTQVEHAAFAQAAIEYQASLDFLDGQIKSLMTAITGE